LFLPTTMVRSEFRLEKLLELALVLCRFAPPFT
jgi:hypothetical protein